MAIMRNSALAAYLCRAYASTGRIILCPAIWGRRTAREVCGITRADRPMCKAREARLMDACRIGLIGAGNVGRRHAQVLSTFPDQPMVVMAAPAWSGRAVR